MKESPARDKRVKELHIIFCEFELSRGKLFLGVSAFAMRSHSMRILHVFLFQQSELKHRWNKS